LYEFLGVIAHTVHFDGVGKFMSADWHLPVHEDRIISRNTKGLRERQFFDKRGFNMMNIKANYLFVGTYPSLSTMGLRNYPGNEESPSNIISGGNASIPGKGLTRVSTHVLRYMF